MADELFLPGWGPAIAYYEANDNFYPWTGFYTYYTGGVFGRDGNDTLRGNDGERSVMWGNQGNDQIFGANFGDYMHGGQGADVLTGGGGNDTMFGNKGSDALYAGDGNDSLYGGQENDYLEGGNGADYISGDKGYDLLVGNAGRDRFVIQANTYDQGLDPYNVYQTDRILDYNDSEDYIVLSDGLTFNDVATYRDNVNNSGLSDIVIWNIRNGQNLAVLLDQPDSTVLESVDFNPSPSLFG